MPSYSIFQQLQYAYVGSAYIFFDDCDFTWTTGTTQQRNLDSNHVARLVDNFEVQGIEQMGQESHISVTVKLSTILAYGTEERQALGIRLKKEAPPSDAGLHYYSRFAGFFAATGAKFEVQAGMHRLHAIHEFASRQALLLPPVIVDQGFVADVYDPDRIKLVDLELLRSNLPSAYKADNEGRIWWRMASVLESIPANSSGDIADYDQFSKYVLGKDTGANTRTISLFRSHWQAYISKLLCFPAYQDQFKISSWDFLLQSRLHEPWYRRIDTLHNNLSNLVGGRDGYKHLDDKSLQVLRTIQRPRTEDSIRTTFRVDGNNDLKSDTGLEADKYRRRDLFTKMTAEEYYNCLDTLIELDENYHFPLLKDLTLDSKNGIMAIANQLGMHVCRWVQPDTMQEAKNSPINSRCSIRAVLSTFSIIANDPTHIAPVSSPAVDHAPRAVTAIVPKATLTHFEDSLCELATKYQVDFTVGTLERKPVLSLESLGKETIPEYRRRFVNTAGWRALMELVVTYFGAECLQHESVNGFVLDGIVPPIEFNTVDVIVPDTSKAIIADPRISNNPALRSSAAIAELETLQNELLLRWQVKWTETFLDTSNHHMTREEIRDNEHPDHAREFASKALSAYKLELASREKRGLGIRGLEIYSNQAPHIPQLVAHQTGSQPNATDILNCARDSETLTEARSPVNQVTDSIHDPGCIAESEGSELRKVSYRDMGRDCLIVEQLPTNSANIMEEYPSLQDVPGSNLQITSWAELLNLSPQEVEPDVCEVEFQARRESFVLRVADEGTIMNEAENRLVDPPVVHTSSLSRELSIPSDQFPAVIPNVSLGSTSTDDTQTDRSASEQGRKRKITASEQSSRIGRNTISTRESKRLTHVAQSSRPVSETQRDGPTRATGQQRDRRSLGPIKVTGIKKRSGRGNRGRDGVQG